MHPIPESVRSFIDEVQAHREALRGWLRVRFPSITDTDNLIQESMSRVWRAMATDNVASSPRALLFATAHNMAIDHVRRERIVRIESVDGVRELPVPEDRPSPADTTARNQELELLTRAIQALPERCRQVLTLRKIYGLSQKQIAARLGISEHTVEAQVANGMRRCAHYLGRLGLP